MGQPTSTAVFSSDEITYATANDSTLAGYSGDLDWTSAYVVTVAESAGTDTLSRLERLLLRIWMWILKQLAGA